MPSVPTGSPFIEVMMSPGRTPASAAGEPAATPATQIPARPLSASVTALPLIPSDSKSPCWSLPTTVLARSEAIAKNCSVVVAWAPPA